MADTKTIKVEHGYGGLWYVGWLFTVAIAQLPVGRAPLGPSTLHSCLRRSPGQHHHDRGR